MGRRQPMWIAFLKGLMKKSRKTVAQESSNPSTEISKISWRIKLTERCLKHLGKLSTEDRLAANEALGSVLNAWGAPHAHHGAGIRKLGPKLFECRVGLRLRLLFQLNPSERELIFFEMGDHDKIRRLLRNW